jgi:predicted amino acid racemase
MERQYPCLMIQMDALRQNFTAAAKHCAAMGIRLAGVVKGCNALPEVARAYRNCGASELASSRIEQIIRLKEAGIPGPYLLLRIPMLTECEEVVRWCDTSLNSENAVLDELERACVHQNKTHQVIIMADLGDLREGFWDKDEMVAACVRVERELPHLHLLGVGVNLGCYGAIQPTPEKLGELVAIAERVEEQIGRKLEVISGGATSSYTLVHWGTMPTRINHLRIGEGTLLAKDLHDSWGIRDMDDLRRDTMVLQAQVLEVKTKPTYPQGTITIDAFGHTPTYEDHGMRRRALVGLGRADVGALEELIPCEAGVRVIGGSSDHCILDVQDCEREVRVGDILSFRLNYSHMLYATAGEIPVHYINL